MRQHIDQARHATAQERDSLRGGRLKHLDIRVRSHGRTAQAVRQIHWHPRRQHRPQVLTEGNTLQQLTDLRVRQLDIQLRLTQQHQLQQLALLRLQVGEQAQALHRAHGNGLGLINADHYTPPG